MGNKSKIAWTDATVNFFTGCQPVSEACANCVTPETLILYADMIWRPIGEAKVGDEIIGFDETRIGQETRENGISKQGRGHRCIRKTKIENVIWSKREAYKITTETGEITASSDHPFLAGNSRSWIKPSSMTIKTKLRDIGYISDNYSDFSIDYKKGYLRGETDSDGTLRYDPVKYHRHDFQCWWRVAQKDIETIQRLQQFMSDLKIADLSIDEFRVKSKNSGTFKTKNGAISILHKIETRSLAILKELTKQMKYLDDNIEYVKGWLAGFFDGDGSFNGSNLRFSNTNMDFINRIVKYMKLLDFETVIETIHREKRNWKTMYNVRLKGNRGQRLRFFSLVRPALLRKTQALIGHSLDFVRPLVKGINSVGIKKLVDITTGTRTFFANGFMVHNCYAKGTAEWLRGLDPKGKYRNGFDFTVHVHNEQNDWTKVLRSKKSKKIFINSMSDIFFEKATFEDIKRQFEIMKNYPQHIYQLLTKRTTERSLKIMAELYEHGLITDNMWMGVTIELQKYMIPRLKWLDQTPFKVKWVSAEPLLGALDFTQYPHDVRWIVTGGESGSKARPLQMNWLRDIRDYCFENRIAFFHKQHGGTKKCKCHDAKGCLLIDGEVHKDFPRVPSPEIFF